MGFETRLKPDITLFVLYNKAVPMGFETKKTGKSLVMSAYNKAVPMGFETRCKNYLDLRM